MPMNAVEVTLPGLDCGICGYRTCAAFAERLEAEPELLKRCVMLEKQNQVSVTPRQVPMESEALTGCASCTGATFAALPFVAGSSSPWKDSLGRDFDFFLEHLPEDPGPREIILPHNPLLTREMEISPGDVMIGRPLGMSCGCPITHCGVVMSVEPRTGVIVWCVTGPLRPRQEGFKDIGYYSAEAYEGVVRETNVELRIGCRYYFQPRRCMLQWRHSGLINFINRTAEGLRIRLEGLWIG